MRDEKKYDAHKFSTFRNKTMLWLSSNGKMRLFFVYGGVVFPLSLNRCSAQIYKIYS